jgi:hypothetical protein
MFSEPGPGPIEGDGTPDRLAVSAQLKWSKFEGFEFGAKIVRRSARLLLSQPERDNNDCR